MDLILRGGLRNPLLADAYITNVILTDDLRHARIYFRLTRQEVDAKQQEAALRALGGSSGHIRRELGPKLQLKFMPDLVFFWDEGVDRAARVEAVLDELRKQRQGDA